MSHSSSTATNVFLGLDIGSVNARLATVDRTGHILHLDAERINRGPAHAVQALLERLPEAMGEAHIAGAGATGSARSIFSAAQGWQIVSSPYSAIVGVLSVAPETRTIIEIGGQSAFVVGLEGGLSKPWRVSRSPLCAAGTGRFLEQQASRLNIDIGQFGEVASTWQEAPPRIAARCSVFAKSDLIHLQQKGWPVAGMLAGLADSVARMLIAQWRDEFVSPLVLVGGVAQNEAVRGALSAALGGQRIEVPPQAAFMEAIGVALHARKAPGPPQQLRPSADESDTYYLPRKLPVQSSTAEWTPPKLDTAAGPLTAYLGVDIGSTSTKAAVVDANGHVLAKHYLMTAGQPLAAVQQVMAALAPQVEGKVEIKGAGITGSGRYLVGRFIGADLIKNEITAQTRAALHLEPQVDTVFELGGQDSKYVYLENGTVLDYQMNKACAAGTGSFIDELAEQLEVSTRNGQFASLAAEAEQQLDLGERCAAFMSQAVTSAQHAEVPLPVIVSSLSTSLAKNYRSKVVGNRRVGKRVFLTGAVFYNEAVVAAFRAEYPGKEFTIPEHKEVTGAIGVALLARDQGLGGKSSFRGFSAVANQTYKLTQFNCHHCDNNCAISMMTLAGGERLYYGSRCDRYDAGVEAAGAPLQTAFDEREELLFRGLQTAVGSPIRVGVPRALMTYDLAPLLIEFFTRIGVETVLSPRTNQELIELSMKHAYTDSCYPVKLLHGHVASLLAEGVDYIAIPNAIRMGLKSGDEDQRYSCPLVQAAPYIITSVFNLGEQLLDPLIDLSSGDDLTIDSLAKIAVKLGKSRDLGKAAARAALRRQRDFEAELQQRGDELLARVETDPGAIGVVLLSRAYNAQDEGANLGMAHELAKLGVIPIPLDYLRLDTVDVSEISDRPYWNYERKLLAAARLIAAHPRLYGLFLNNFGCGPNSIIQNIVEDIMGGKPLGQIEIDEHAAEAGYITRLEALVDTLRGYQLAQLADEGVAKDYVRRVPSSFSSGETVLVARMADHADVVAAVMRSFGVRAQVLPESDERSIALSRNVTSGKECLPYRDSLGVFLRMAEDKQIPPGARALMAGSFGPCRLGKYAQEQQKILDELGIDLLIKTTVSNNAYSDLGLGTAFEVKAWQAIVAVDVLEKLLWSTRPYERVKGSTDLLYHQLLQRVVAACEAGEDLSDVLKGSAAEFLALQDSTMPRRPLVGINGEIYLRANRFSNQDLVLACEQNGLEAEVAPMGEWLKYTTVRNLEDAVVNRDIKRLLKGVGRKFAVDYFEKRVNSWFAEAELVEEPSTRELLAASGHYLPARCGSEAVLSLGSGVRQMRDDRYAGVISVMPHGCMPGGIVAAIAQQVSRQHDNKPWISLTYDGFADKVNPERIADLAEQVKHRLGAAVR